MVRPFIDEGNFIAFHRALIDEVMPNLSPVAWKVLCFIIRKTAGWQKESDDISYSQIMEGAGIVSRSTVSEALHELQGEVPLRDGRKILGWIMKPDMPQLIISTHGQRQAGKRVATTNYALNRSLVLSDEYVLRTDNKQSLISNREDYLLIRDLEREIEKLGESDMTSILTLDELQSFDPAPRISGDWARYLCPLCGSDKPKDDAHRSFCRKLPGLGFKCQRCSASGWMGKPVDFQSIAPTPSKPKTDWREQWRKANPQPLLDSAGDRYLSRRGVDSKLAAQSGVVFSGRLFGRAAVCFPIRDQNEALIAVQGRYIDNSNPKCRGAGMVSKGVFSTAGAFDTDLLAVCEAPIDALSFAQTFDIPAIALCGVPPLPGWVLEKFKGELLLASDNDEAGERAAVMWAKQAGGKIFTRRVRPNAKDWNADLTG